jgi:hypothetical protein
LNEDGHPTFETPSPGATLSYSRVAVPGLEGDQRDPPQRRSGEHGEETGHQDQGRQHLRRGDRADHLLDIVFSIDSILTAVGMTEHCRSCSHAVIIAVALMLVAADPLANFINKNPSIVMLALGFLLMIGMTLIADGFGAHVPKGYIYAAMAFSGLVEGLNMLSRKASRSKKD